MKYLVMEAFNEGKEKVWNTKDWPTDRHKNKIFLKYFALQPNILK